MNNSILRNIFAPSSLSFLIIAVGFLFFYLEKNRWAKKLIFLGILFFYLFSTTPVSDLVIAPLENNYEIISASEMKKADTIVVLSGGKKADTIRSSEVLRISNLRNHQTTLIISGTVPLMEREGFSKIESFFINRGIPSEKIRVEDVSENTRENAFEVAKKIGENPFFLVTSAYHMKRSLIEFEKVNANPIPAPTDFRKKGKPYGFRDYIPNSGNLRKSDLGFHEYMGILYYRFFD